MRCARVCLLVGQSRVHVFPALLALVTYVRVQEGSRSAQHARAKDVCVARCGCGICHLSAAGRKAGGTATATVDDSIAGGAVVWSAGRQKGKTFSSFPSSSVFLYIFFSLDALARF